MDPIILTIGLFLAYIFVWRPIVAFEEARREREFQRGLRYTKLRFVRRRYYPILKRFTYREIEETFDVESAYQRMFTSRL